MSAWVSTLPQRELTGWSAPPPITRYQVPEERLPGGWSAAFETHEVEPERPIEPPP
jgi:hypothetical protein